MNTLTPAQTVGPYFHIGLAWPEAWRLVQGNSGAEKIVINGRVLDGDGAPVVDALIEIWQADADGTYHPHADGAGFRGVGRCAVDALGGFCFQTVKPGPVAAPVGGLQAPHINVLVMARGLLQHLYTRLYFDDDAPLHDHDAVLACVPRARRATLLATRRSDAYVFDIHLQGEHETVFFAL